MNRSTQTDAIDDTVTPSNSSAEKGAGESNLRLSWPHLYLGALGFAISLYALRVHNLIEAGGKSGCSYSDEISCDKVLSSPYAEIMGIPLGVFGMAYFVVVILTGIITNSKTTPRQAALQRLLVMSAGICGSIAMMYISIAIIGAECPICMATHAVVLTLFIISLVQFLKTRRNSNTQP